MKSFIPLISIMIFAAESRSQTLEIQQFSAVVAKHRMIAILPLLQPVDSVKTSCNASQHDYGEKKIEISTTLQHQIYNVLLGRIGDYSVDVQNIEKTNRKLNEARMEEKLRAFTNAEIAAVLGVDAVLVGKYDVEEKGASGTGKTLLYPPGDQGMPATNRLTLTLYDGPGGKLLWHSELKSENSDKPVYDLPERMSDVLTRYFPYLNQLSASKNRL